MIKKILIVLLVALVVIQFIRPAKNISASPVVNDISKLYPVPDSVHQVLIKACYDCHSNNTNYPWYANIQPVFWWMQNHVNDGKKHLNFDEYATYKEKRKVKKMKEIASEIEEGEMPLDSYTWIHKNAILTKEEKELVINWASGIYAQMPDSLKKKKQ